MRYKVQSMQKNKITLGIFMVSVLCTHNKTAQFEIILNHAATVLHCFCLAYSWLLMWIFY